MTATLTGGVTKVCNRCNQEKPIEEFYKNRDRTLNQCKQCCRDAAATNVSDPAKKARKVETDKVAKDRAVARNRKFVNDFLAQNPCVDCGEDDWVVLEFDHVRGEKICEVSLMIYRGNSLDMIIEEILKCDVRCANCHRRITWQRRQESGVPSDHAVAS